LVHTESGEVFVKEKLNLLLMRRMGKFDGKDFVLSTYQTCSKMRKNRKFAKNARNRQVMAFFLSMAICASLFAAMSYGENWMELLPDFLKELIEKDSEVPRA